MITDFDGNVYISVITGVYPASTWTSPNKDASDQYGFKALASGSGNDVLTITVDPGIITIPLGEVIITGNGFTSTITIDRAV